MVASAIRTIGLSASCEPTRALSTSGRFLSTLARGAYGSIRVAISTVMSGISETMFIRCSLSVGPRSREVAILSRAQSPPVYNGWLERYDKNIDCNGRIGILDG